MRQKSRLRPGYLIPGARESCPTSWSTDLRPCGCKPPSLVTTPASSEPLSSARGDQKGRGPLSSPGSPLVPGEATGAGAPQAGGMRSGKPPFRHSPAWGSSDLTRPSPGAARAGLTCRRRGGVGATATLQRAGTARTLRRGPHADSRELDAEPGAPVSQTASWSGSGRER